MLEENIRERFGDIAIRKGFITKDQFIEAMARQIESEPEKSEPLLIGSILKDMGYMTAEQIAEVVEEMNKSEVPVCPNCGIQIIRCPNCGAYLR